MNEFPVFPVLQIKSLEAVLCVVPLLDELASEDIKVLLIEYQHWVIVSAETDLREIFGSRSLVESTSERKPSTGFCLSILTPTNVYFVDCWGHCSSEEVMIGTFESLAEGKIFLVNLNDLCRSSRVAVLNSSDDEQPSVWHLGRSAWEGLSSLEKLLSKVLLESLSGYYS